MALSFSLECSALYTTRALEAELIHTPNRKTLQATASFLKKPSQRGRTAAWEVRNRIHRQPGQEADLTALATWGFWEHTQSSSCWKSGLMSPGCLGQDVPCLEQWAQDSDTCLCSQSLPPKSTALAGQAENTGPDQSAEPVLTTRTSFLTLSAHECTSAHSPTSSHKVTRLYKWQRVFILAALNLTNAHQKRKVRCEEYRETEAMREEMAGVAWQLDSSFLPWTPELH